MCCSSPVSVDNRRLAFNIQSAKASHVSRLPLLLWAVAIFLISGVASANAETFTVFGPQNYTRGTGAPVTVTSKFSVLNPNIQYTLKAFNGGLQDSQTELVSSGFVTVNGVQVVGPSNFNQNVVEVDVPITLLGTNTIDVQVRGAPGGLLTVEIVGVENAPVITATVSPSPNAAGWNNTNVTVTFTCSDATSPITSCPAPQTVATEGAGQIISGTATDAAGNSASTSVTLNIDKTPPAIRASVSPAPNAAGWNNSNVTVSFTCSDSLSGVAGCPSPVAVTTEGANQVISGATTDVAGNSATTSVTVELDKTPPTISITSPANGATFTSSSVGVTGTVSDALSGIAAVTCDGTTAIVQSGSFSCSVALNAGSNTITAQSTDVAGNTSSADESVTVSGTPTITFFSPTSGPIGTQITLTGRNFTAGGTVTPQITLSQQGGSSIVAPVTSFTDTSISFVIPTGATSGVVTVTANGQSATSTASLSVVVSSNFTVAAGPSSASVQQGTSTAYSVTLSSNNGFSQLASLSVTGVPTGVTTQFTPSQITAGQSSILTVTAPAGQTVGSATLTISASATVDGISTTQSASVSLAVQTATTSLIGRTVDSDSNETPIPGIIMTMLGVDDAGNPTGCSGQTRSDAAGNFAFTNLSTSCLGRQLVSFDGNSATDGEKYAGINLAYTLVAGQVTGPELVHMPDISDAETIMVQQNASVDQTFSYSTIPGVTVTVYAGTTLTMPDGTKPNPFPMAAVLVPVDRLPDAPSPTAGTLRASIVAFQPANTTSSLPVSVTFPNVVNNAPGVNMELDTLDPIVGELVKYGTGTVSADATKIVPDADPAHPGHRFGISHFDWHGPMAPAPNGHNPCPSPPCAKGGDPVDLSSGLLNFTKTDISFGGARGRVSIQRTYRTLSGAPGPFGVGTNHNYGYQLDVSNFVRGTGTFVTLVMPDGNQLQFVQQGTSTFVNSTVPTLLGAVITSPASGTYNLRWKNGTVFNFQTSAQGALLAFLNSITDTNGNAVTLVRGNSNQPIQITQIIDPVGRTLNIAYDNFNRILSLTDPIGRTVRYTYNSQGTLATVTDPAGGITTYAYDAQNRMTTITDPRNIPYLQNVFDADGRVIQQTAPDGGVSKFAYTLINPTVPTSPVLLTTVTDPRGNITTYHFNPQGFVIDTTDALGEKTIYNLDAGTNNVLSMTDPLGRITAYTYDEVGNITSVTRSAGTPNAVTTFYSYDSTFSQASTVTDGLGHVTSFKYDTAGNVTSITDPLNHQTTFSYDSNGELLTTTDALGNTTRSAYVNGDMVSITDPLNRTTTRTTDAIGRLTAITNPLGQTTKLQYSPLGQITQVVDAHGQPTSFQYDGNGNLLSVTDANQHATSFSFDKLDRIATRTDPLGNIEKYQYDLAGNLTQFTDRRGVISLFTFDTLNRKTNAAFGTESSIAYSYDAASRLIQAVDSTAGTLTRTYDGLDRMISETTPQGSVAYSYDASGRRTSMTASGQSAVNYAYDDANRLTQITQGTRSVSFNFDADNRAATLTLPNGIVVHYAYDAVSQITAIDYTQGAATLGNLTYTYDLSGRGITSVGGSFARIALPAALASSSYNADNQVTQFASSQITYDANGNIVSDGVNTYVWNSRNQLASISGAASASFQYDIFGRRTAKQVGGNSVAYLYDGNTPVAELSGGAVIAATLNGGVDRYFQRSDATGSSDFLTDILGNTLALTDSTGAPQTQYTYEPFGNTSFTGSTSTNPFQFTGRENDGTGLYFYRARYYSPTLQRFISEDTNLFSGSQNLYAYAFNNPVRFSDASGHCPWCIVAGIGAVVGGAVDGYEAYKHGCSLGQIAVAAGRGAVAGGVGAVTGLGVGLLTGNAFAGGAAAGFSNDVVKYALGGGGSVGKTVIDTAAGGAFGVVAEAVGPEVIGGQNFNPFTSPRTFGPRAMQDYANEATGDALGAAKDLSSGEGGGEGGGGGSGDDTSGRKNKSGCN